MSHNRSDVLLSLLDHCFELIACQHSHFTSLPKTNLREAIRSGCNPKLMNSRLTYSPVNGCKFDFKVSLFSSCLPYSFHSFSVFHSFLGYFVVCEIP